MNRGLLIALEGVDGAGKTTQAEGLSRHFRSLGHDVLATKEPTGGPYGERIRKLSFSRAPVESVPPEEELRWFVEDRRMHVAAEIGPGLSAGKTVVTDRYYLSSVAYQGARGLDFNLILEDSEAEFPIPDIAFVLILDPAEGLERVRARGNGLNPRFERLPLLHRAAEIFREIRRPYIASIDGSLPVGAVSRQILETLRSRLAIG